MFRHLPHFHKERIIGSVNPFKRLRPFPVLLALLLLLPSRGFAQDYKFLDEWGTEVTFPKDVPIHSMKNPGPWGKVASLHLPQVKVSYRNEGLEKILVLHITLNHPMLDAKLGSIKKIYIVDKDNLIVGYHEFKAKDKRAETKISVNGVINYVQIYIFCSKHEGWTSELRL